MNTPVCNKYEYILSISSYLFFKILFSSGFIDTNGRKSQYDSKIIIRVWVCTEFMLTMERQRGQNLEIYYFFYFFSVLYNDQILLMEDNLNSYLLFEIKYIECLKFALDQYWKKNP